MLRNNAVSRVVALTAEISQHVQCCRRTAKIALKTTDPDRGLLPCRKMLDSLPARAPNYPGSEPRLDDFCKRFPDAEEHGWVAPGVTGAQPVRLRTGLTPETVSTASPNDCESHSWVMHALLWNIVSMPARADANENMRRRFVMTALA